jgi:hypothetical protein
MTAAVNATAITTLFFNLKSSASFFFDLGSRRIDSLFAELHLKRAIIC